MSRERKVNIYCYHCNRTGMEYITEEYHDGSWQRVCSALSEGWHEYNGGYVLCPKCEHDPEAWREIKASRKRERKENFTVTLIVLIALGISALICYFVEPFFPIGMGCATIPIILALFAWSVIKKTVGPIVWAVIIGFVWGLPALWVGESKMENTSETNDVAQKIPAYLSGIDDISSNKELGDFYFSVASKFYYNQMGLKGSQEQIDAGNKLMVRVYDFLGSSARRGMLNVDSMKFFVENYVGVSDFRKKKALEDLQIGIEKIESLND